MNKQLKACLILLENLLFGKVKFSRRDFMKKLESENLSSSNSSVSRILNKINIDFGIKIQHNNDFYEISLEETEIDYFNRYKTIKNLLFREILQKNIIENSLVSQFISFENESLHKGVMFIEDGLTAIIENRKLKITYQSFHEIKTTEYIASPLFLKEFHRRWYLIAEINIDKQLKIFALDRIHDLEILKINFTSEKNQYDLFKNTIGINHSDEVHKIKLWFNAWQANYVKTLPLHSSQKIISEDENGTIISLDVNVNFELEQLIKSYGSAVKVLKPNFLKLKVIQDLKNTISSYE